jgi:hypothetical protein
MVLKTMYVVGTICWSLLISRSQERIRYIGTIPRRIAKHEAIATTAYEQVEIEATD